MIYFAYGSNMDPAQIGARCPSSAYLSIAVLPGYRLDFTRRSKIRRCGVAGVVVRPLAQVWGVLYVIEDRKDITRLDRREGYGPGRRINAYRRVRRPVLLGGDTRRTMVAELYAAERQISVPPPSAEYMGHLIRGARHWGLPPAYTAFLENIETA